MHRKSDKSTPGNAIVDEKISTAEKFVEENSPETDMAQIVIKKEEIAEPVVPQEATEHLPAVQEDQPVTSEENLLVIKGQFTCDICKRVFINRSVWLKHTKKPHEHLCKTCNIFFSSPRERFDHNCKYKCKVIIFQLSHLKIFEAFVLILY
jgi:hypothetical protein